VSSPVPEAYNPSMLQLQPPASPCIKVCMLDERGSCTGCLRTAMEIARWRDMSPGEQWQLIAVLRQRRAALSAVPPPPHPKG
jgi:uncharacterized protein